MMTSENNLPIIPVRGEVFPAIPIRTGLRGGLIFLVNGRAAYYQRVIKTSDGKPVLVLGPKPRTIPEGLNAADYLAAIFFEDGKATALRIKGLSPTGPPTMLFERVGEPVSCDLAVAF